jgi:hypothetical protein
VWSHESTHAIVELEWSTIDRCSLSFTAQCRSSHVDTGPSVAIRSRRRGHRIRRSPPLHGASIEFLHSRLRLATHTIEHIDAIADPPTTAVGGDS